MFPGDQAPESPPIDRSREVSTSRPASDSPSIPSGWKNSWVTRLRRSADRWGRMAWLCLGRVRFVDLLRMEWPYVLPAGCVPPMLSVELTNICQLGCTYCTSPASPRSRGYMDSATWAPLRKRIAEEGVPRVRFVGNGEPTLHPHFAEMVREVANCKAVRSIVTNAERLNAITIVAMLESMDTIHVSVEGQTRERYEGSRTPGSSFSRLLENLRALQRRKRELRKRVLIDIRVMLRPSEFARRQELLAFWRPYGDVVTPMAVLNLTGLDPDTFRCFPEANAFPRCTLPARSLQVQWDGQVMICTTSNWSSGYPRNLSLGDIRNNSIAELWHHPLMRQYQTAHRHGDTTQMPLCQGCFGAT